MQQENAVTTGEVEGKLSALKAPWGWRNAAPLVQRYCRFQNGETGRRSRVLELSQVKPDKLLSRMLEAR